MSKVSELFKVVSRFVSDNSPVILTAFAVGGVATTTAFAITGTIKAVSIRDELYEEYFNDEVLDEPTKVEVLKAVWPYYVPAFGMAIVTIGCVIGSNHINQRRNAALASVYGLTEAAFREYKDKVVEIIGEKKETAIRDEIATDELKKYPVSEPMVIKTGFGTTLCRDSLSGQYFRSDIDEIKKAVNDFNFDLNREIFLSLNEWYDMLGIENVELGRYLGWDVERGQLAPSYTSGLASNGEPCLVIKYNIVPKSPR